MRLAGRAALVVLALLGCSAVGATGTAHAQTFNFEGGALSMGNNFNRTDVLRDANQATITNTSVTPGVLTFPAGDAGFTFPAFSTQGFGYNVTFDIALTEQATGSYNDTTGQLDTQPADFVVTVTTQQIGSPDAPEVCNATVELSFSTETQTPMPGVRFDPAATLGNGAVVAAWSDLVPVPATVQDDCGIADIVMNGPGALWLGKGINTPPGTMRTLTVSAMGSGSVTGPGINCPGDCTESYAHGTPVSLSAVPGMGQSLISWSGACSGSGACDLTMDGAKSVGAQFSAPAAMRALTVQVTGPGTVMGNGISCPGTCAGSYSHGTLLTLTAYPDLGQVLTGWGGTGLCAGDANPCQASILIDSTVTATFAAAPVDPPDDDDDSDDDDDDSNTGGGAGAGAAKKCKKKKKKRSAAAAKKCRKKK